MVTTYIYIYINNKYIRTKIRIKIRIKIRKLVSRDIRYKDFLSLTL